MLSVKEIAQRLGVSVNTVYRAIEDGDLIAYQFQRLKRVTLEDFEDYVRRSRIAPDVQP